MKSNSKMKIKNEMKIQQQNEDLKWKEDQKWNEEQQHHKNLTGVSPKQINIAGSFMTLDFKKMITEVLLILPL